MQFSEVIGQEKAKYQLIRSFKEDRISHAHLFVGPEGAGALALALAFAQYLNCLNPSETDSCGECASCRKSLKRIHPDIHYSFPTIGSKEKSNNFIVKWREALSLNPYLNSFEWLQFIDAENKQGNITAEECESILRKLSLTTYESKYKVLIMWMPEYLGKEGNRLLKLIEEPPDNTVFILVSENKEKILNTIISRAQLLTIPRLRDESLATELVQKHQIPEEMADTVAALAEGNFTRALSLMKQSQTAYKQLALKWFGHCTPPKAAGQVAFVEEVAKFGREQQKNFLKYCMYILQQGLHSLLLPQKKSALSKAEKQMCLQLAESLSIEDYTKFIQELENAHVYLVRNANPRILFLQLSIFLGDTYLRAENRNKQLAF